MKGRVLLRMLTLAAALVGGGCAESQDVPETASLAFDGAPQQSMPTQSGQYNVKLWWSPAVPRVGFNAAELVVSDDRGVAMVGLDVAAQPWMPAFNQGTDVTPTVSEVKPGVYLAARIDFFMSADWELRLRISGSTQDTASPTVRVR